MVRIRVHFYGRRKRAVITDVNTGFDPRNDGKRTDVNVTADVYLAFVSKAGFGTIATIMEGQARRLVGGSTRRRKILSLVQF